MERIFFIHQYPTKLASICDVYSFKCNKFALTDRSLKNISASRLFPRS